MDHIKVTLPDGSVKDVEPGTRVADLAAAISPRLAKSALAGIVDGRMVDLSCPIGADATVRLVTPESPEALDLYRHSAAHLMAAAVVDLFPGTQCGIGPATDDGFYYDFVVARPFVPEDLEAIERRMREIAARDLRFERRMVAKDEAKAFFAERGEPLKVQLIEEKGGAEVSCYAIDGLFTDFCTGPHVPSTGRLKAFKLLTTSNAYWKGDAQGQPMQRVYGTAFFTDAELKAHLARIEEAKRRDHRKLGRELGLFMFHPWAPGAAFWLGKGATVYNLLADYMREVLFPAGYVEVKTPLIFNKALWETSGHWQHYRQNMFTVEAEGDQMGVKAMNCPGHMLVFGSEGRSYRDLPLRYHEQTPLHRNEASGVLSGLTRVRQFAQDDAHIYCAEEQIADEVRRFVGFLDKIYSAFGLKYSAKFSTRPPQRIGDDATWDKSEAALEGVLKTLDIPYETKPGEGAFYGPKIDFDVSDSIGRKWQLGTMQLDRLAAERFNLSFVGEDNAEHKPIVLHRAIYGSFERFIAILIEHYAGAFPTWLAPVQVVLVTVADRHLDYARKVAADLHKKGYRVEVDDRGMTLNAKIREHQIQKVPFTLVVGDKEQEQGAVAPRRYGGEDLKTMKLEAFLELLAKEAALPL
jgi:threonyl-tRNA synthetase